VNRRRKLLIGFGAGALAAPLAIFAQQPSKVYRVGWLGTGSPSGDTEFVDDVKSALYDMGYRNGRSIVFERRDADFRSERLAGLAAELVALKPAVIVAGATAGTRAAQQATATIPIVMLNVADPVGAGFVASLAHPGGNITGVASLGLDMAAKSLELLHAVVPKATRIVVLVTSNPSHPAIANEIARAGKTLGLIVLPMTAASLEEIETAFGSMAKENAQALIVVADSLTLSNRKRIASLAAETKLPAIYSFAEQVEAGGLLSYGPNPHNLDKVVARYIDKILKGAKPGDLPVEQPSEFELVINLSAAKALGIAFPQEILLRADRTIQ
jgi:putative ABC transport system substrate-binding protein